MGGNEVGDAVTDYAYPTESGGWRITGSRVSLDSVARAYLEGQSPEAIVDSFPALSLEQVYGAIAFYLRNQNEIDVYLARQDARWEQVRARSEALNQPLLARIRAARPHLLSERQPK
jgi:uncharacterized protein (DUF433 family)